MSSSASRRETAPTSKSLTSRSGKAPPVTFTRENVLYQLTDARVILTAIGISIAVCSVVIALVIGYVNNYYSAYRTELFIMEGTGNLKKYPVPEIFLNRSHDQIALEEILVVKSNEVGHYSLIIGPHGCGKSTLASNALDEILSKSGGCLYIPIRIKEYFFDDFSDAFGDVRDKIWLPSQVFHYLKPLNPTRIQIKSNEEVLRFLISVIGPMTLKYADKTGQKFTIVFDGINCFLGTPFLLDFQLTAKLLSDEYPMHIVFIDSGGGVRNEFIRHSASSRMVVYGIGDVSQEQAMTLLKTNTTHSVNMTEVFRRVTGGRLQLLWDVRNYFHRYPLASLADVIGNFSREPKKRIQKCIDLPNGEDTTQKILVCWTSMEEVRMQIPLRICSAPITRRNQEFFHVSWKIIYYMRMRLTCFLTIPPLSELP